MFSKQNPEDQRLLNWSAVRGSNTDFNANSRATQGGCGFASATAGVTSDPCTNNNTLTPVNPAVYDHGIVQGASDALDAQTLWIFAAVRPLHQPQGNASALAAGQRSSQPIVPPAMGEPSGRRARSSTATIPPPSLRTARSWTPASPGSRRRLL